METLLTILAIFGAPGFVFGIMFIPFAFDNPRPSSFLLALYGVCYSTIASIVLIPTWLTYKLLKMLNKTLPKSVKDPFNKHVLPYLIKRFNKLPKKLRYKLGDWISSIDCRTLVNIHEIGFDIIGPDLKWVIRIEKKLNNKNRHGKK